MNKSQSTPNLSSSQTLKSKSQKHKLAFTGYLQPSTSKAPTNPPVLYHKGGDDFRTAYPTSFGRQPISGKHLRSAGKTVFTVDKRFYNDKYKSPGPKYDPVSSMGKQVSSQRITFGATGFGTSSREGALKLYAIYTANK